MRCGRERFVQSMLAHLGGSEQWTMSRPADRGVPIPAVSVNIFFAIYLRSSCIPSPPAPSSREHATTTPTAGLNRTQEATIIHPLPSQSPMKEEPLLSSPRPPQAPPPPPPLAPTSRPQKELTSSSPARPSPNAFTSDTLTTYKQSRHSLPPTRRDNRYSTIRRSTFPAAATDPNAPTIHSHHRHGRQGMKASIVCCTGTIFLLHTPRRTLLVCVRRAECLS